MKQSQGIYIVNGFPGAGRANPVPFVAPSTYSFEHLGNRLSSVVNDAISDMKYHALARTSDGGLNHSRTSFVGSNVGMTPSPSLILKEKKTSPPANSTIPSTVRLDKLPAENRRVTATPGGVGLREVSSYFSNVPQTPVVDRLDQSGNVYNSYPFQESVNSAAAGAQLDESADTTYVEDVEPYIDTATGKSSAKYEEEDDDDITQRYLAIRDANVTTRRKAATASPVFTPPDQYRSQLKEYGVSDTPHSKNSFSPFSKYINWT